MRYLSILTFLFSIALNNSAHAGVLIKHIIRTMLTITVACCSVSVCHAGVITVVGGYVTTAELDQDGVDGEDTNVKFTNTSYNNIKSTPTTDTMPWHDGFDGLAANLATDLVNTLNATSATLTTTSLFYVFTYDFDFGTDVFAYMVYKSGNTWTKQDAGYDVAAIDHLSTSYGGGALFYASLDTGGNSNVPEPSTAIAMGLLGVLGFAGNRRRRRQS